MQSLLHDISVALECDYLRAQGEFKEFRNVVFTGSIDEYFGFDEGRLSYRAQRREHIYLKDVDWYQPAVQVNAPSCPQVDMCARSSGST